MRSKRIQDSVQQEFVRLREIAGDVLCLASSPSVATNALPRTYRAVLEVSAINFTLKAEEEQEAILAGYRAFLKTLTFPLQILIRHQRLDLHDYLERITREPTLDAQRRNASWRELATGLADFIKKLASQRTLIERHCYIVIPLSGEGTLHTPRASFSQLLPGRRARLRQAMAEKTLQKARQELDVRCEMVMQQLASVGLHCRRLQEEELARLYHSCLTPERAIKHPLTSEALSGVGRPSSVGTHRMPDPTIVSHPAHAIRSPHPAHASSGQRIDLRNVSREEEERTSLSGIKKARPTTQQRARMASSERVVGVPPVPLPDLLHLADLLAPASVEVMRDALCVEEEYVRGIAITAFPREISAGGWLAPLLLHDEIAELVFHLHPQDSASMIRQLKRRRASYVATRRFNQRQGRLDDPEMSVAQDDVMTLLSQIASGEERMFDLGFYVLVRAPDRRTLDERTERMMGLLNMLFLDTTAHTTTFEHAQAFRSFLPEARDELMRTVTLDTTSLATALPFISNSLYMPDGVLVGMTDTGEPVMLNAWDERLENPHAFIGGVTGAGKSYLGKLLIERDMILQRAGGQREHIYVIDPDQEYTPLATALGGQIVRIAPGSRQHLNPFDLLPAGCDFQAYLREARRGDRLAEKVQDLHALLDIMLAETLPTSGGTPLSKREKGLLDRALYETYRKVGIATDPRTHYCAPPLMRDLYDVLKSGVCGPDEYGLSTRLYRYVQGSLAGLFAEQTDVDADNALVVWDIRDMRSELRPVGIFLIADCIWTQVLYNSHAPRSLYIDEAASIIEHPEGGRFLATLSRRARKRYLRLITMTQNPELFARDEWGSIVASNAAIKILKMQDRTSVAAVGERFQLTRGEQQRLLTLGKHEALLLAGDKRVLITIQASPCEHALITTDPVELAARNTGQERNLSSQHPLAGSSDEQEILASFHIDEELREKYEGVMNKSSIRSQKSEVQDEHRLNSKNRKKE